MPANKQTVLTDLWRAINTYLGSSILSGSNCFLFLSISVLDFLKLLPLSLIPPLMAFGGAFSLINAALAIHDIFELLYNRKDFEECINYYINQKQEETARYYFYIANFGVIVSLARLVSALAISAGFILPMLGIYAGLSTVVILGTAVPVVTLVLAAVALLATITYFVANTVAGKIITKLMNTGDQLEPSAQSNQQSESVTEQVPDSAYTPKPLIQSNSNLKSKDAYNLYKVCVMGYSSKNKTHKTFLKALLTDDYTEGSLLAEEIIGVDFKVSSCKDNKLQVSNKLQVWFLSNQERYYSIGCGYLNDSSCGILYFDLSNLNNNLMSGTTAVYLKDLQNLGKPIVIIATSDNQYKDDKTTYENKIVPFIERYKIPHENFIHLKNIKNGELDNQDILLPLLISILTNNKTQQETLYKLSPNFENLTAMIAKLKPSDPVPVQQEAHTNLPETTSPTP